MIEPATSVILLRAAMLGAGAVCFGAGSAALLLPPAEAARALRTGLQPSLRLGAVVLALAGLLTLPVQTAHISEDWSQAASPSAIFLFSTGTQAGRAYLVRALLAIACAICILSGPGDRVARLRAGSITAALFLASFAFSGHAVMHEGPTRIVHQANHLAHVLSAGFWLGALIALLTGAIIMLRRPQSQEAEGARMMLWRFSPAGVAAVTLVGLTGAINTWLIVGDMPSDLASSYQVLLLAKIAAAMAMLAFALLNRFYLLPRLEQVSGSRALVASIALESALGGLVIALVAVLATLEPV
ncbi:MAG TPA: copper homeostasis membrane protein CopD [Hyphomicrobium sp.]|nr:copper homeostasis membrane protein CopD [Hyphomicrobium sp.]